MIGEKSSTASSRRNFERKLETAEPRTNSAMGQKIDIIFSGNNYEVGCAEVGVLQKDRKTDKNLDDDGMLKLPNQLKDMLHQMVVARPDLIRKLRAIGFIVMGKFSSSQKEKLTKILNNLLLY